MNRRKRTRKELWQDIKTAGIFFVVAHLYLFIAFGLFACMPSKKIAKPYPLKENPNSKISMPASFSTLIRVSNMGVDCVSQKMSIRWSLEELFRKYGIREPEHFKIKPLSGSSLCGMSVRKDQQAPNGVAKAELLLGWNAISKSELQRAVQVVRAIFGT